MESKTQARTTEERVMAALAHGSVLISLFGPLGAGSVWISQRRKSRYAVFQSLQAMGYQAFLLWVGLTVVLGGVLVFLFSDVLPFVKTSTAMGGLSFHSLMAQAARFQTILLGVWGILCLPGLIGAVLALMGREYYYPWLGRQLETHLAAESDGAWFNEEREDDFVAGICHASAVVVFWGMILPWLVWTSQKDRSKRLRFQALQAFLFQLLMLVSFGLAFILLFGMMALVVALAQYMNSPAGIASDAGLYVIIAVFVMLAFMCILLLALPAYHLFALIAWARTGRGQSYRYPVLGKFLARRMREGDG